MSKPPAPPRERSIVRITLWGSLVNFVLMALKLAFGLMLRSSALIADGIHSLSDLATDAVVLIGAKLSSRPADPSHPYGHKRFDTLASQLIAVILMLVSFSLIRSAALSIFRGEGNYPGAVVLVVAAVSVIAKEMIFRVTRRVSRRIESPSLYANAWHHRSDALSSVAVLIGSGASLLGWGYADPAAAIVVGLLIMAVGLKIFFEGVYELTEHAACRESLEAIRGVLNGEERLAGWHALRTRLVGGELFVDVHVLVDPESTVRRSHDITIDLERRMQKALTKPVHVLIHVEPDGSSPPPL